MTLTDKQLRFLRGRAHSLKAVIQIGKDGLTSGVLAETSRALADHELIKVRVHATERAARDRMLQALAAGTASALVVRIGNVAVLFKPNARLSRFPLPT